MQLRMGAAKGSVKGVVSELWPLFQTPEQTAGSSHVGVWDIGRRSDSLRVGTM